MKEDKPISILRENSKGISITGIVRVSKLSRSFVRTSLTKLEGAKEVSFRKIGIAKVYYFEEKKKENMMIELLLR